MMILKKKQCSFCAEVFQQKFSNDRFCCSACDKSYRNLSAGELWVLQGENKKRQKPKNDQRLWGVGKKAD